MKTKSLVFEAYNRLMQKHIVQNMFGKKQANGKQYLFKTDVSGKIDVSYSDGEQYCPERDASIMFQTFMDAFPEGTNELVNKRREFDCACCWRWIRDFGNVVVINPNLTLTSVWDFETGDPKYDAVNEKMAHFVKTKPVIGLFLADTNAVGIKETLVNTDYGVKTWYHFHTPSIPEQFKFSIQNFKSVFGIDDVKTIGSALGMISSVKDVLEASFDVINMDSLEFVLDLAKEKKLPQYSAKQGILERYIRIFKAHKDVPQELRQNFYWLTACSDPFASRMKNDVLGTFLVDLTKGEDTMVAFAKYTSKTAGDNYQMPKSLHTNAQIEAMKQKLVSLGMMDSIYRRFATTDDISMDDVIFLNRDVQVQKATDPFSMLKDVSAKKTRKQRSMDGIDDISIERFIADIVPTAETIKVLFENEHIPNLFSLIAAKNADAPTLFSWGNSACPIYKGGYATTLKARTKELGGNTDAVLRFTIQWYEDKFTRHDFDAHVKEPRGLEIYFANRDRVHPSSGKLDVDIVDPGSDSRCLNGPAIENITYTDIHKMPDGLYDFFVIVYGTNGNGQGGVRAELEFEGNLLKFEYLGRVRSGQRISFVKVRKSGTAFTVAETHNQVDAISIKTDVWGIQTNEFINVPMIMYSPNYWKKSDCVGNKHYLFPLSGCVNPDQPRGFLNEFLHPRFREHRKAMHALGEMMKVPESQNQLSGLGFPSDKRAALTVQVSGSYNRQMRIKF